MSTRPQELRDRTKAFAIRIVKLYRSLPHTADSEVVGKQLSRLWDIARGELSSSVQRQIAGGMDRQDWTDCRGRDETVFWREMLSDCSIVRSEGCEDILKEARERSAIFTSSQHTARVG